MLYQKKDYENRGRDDDNEPMMFKQRGDRAIVNYNAINYQLRGRKEK